MFSINLFMFDIQIIFEDCLLRLMKMAIVKLILKKWYAEFPPVVADQK